LIKVNVSKEDFKQEIEKAKKGDILGIKGRLGITNKLIDGSVQTADEKQEQTVRAERIQIF
jgi:lysyl-tRNA synthetase class II